MNEESTSFDRLKRARSKYIEAAVFLLRDERSRELNRIAEAFDIIDANRPTLDHWKTACGLKDENP